MIFASDNWSGAHPAISRSLELNGAGSAAAYGASDLDRAVERRFCEVFEREVAVFFVGTGTAANSLALGAVNRPGGVALCHREAHVTQDECGAPEFFTGGARLLPVDGAGGLLDVDALALALARFQPGSVHGGQPMAVSVSQASEAGTLYEAAHLDAVSALAREHGLPLHMDGARFANALAALGQSPAEATWRRGVDILSFGATKNGCWCAEAVVFFDPAAAREFPYLRKRGAQLFSKSRFIAAQFDAYLADGLWLELAAHANRMADGLRAALDAAPRARQAWATRSNEVFAVLARPDAARLREAGAAFYDWPAPQGDPVRLAGDEQLVRLVTSWASTQGEIERFANLLG